MTASGTTVYPGLYKARCTADNGRFLTTYVPQVFGSLAITVSEMTGPRPEPGSFGYISFEGGDTAFPVWISSAGVASPAPIAAFPNTGTAAVSLGGSKLSGTLPDGGGFVFDDAWSPSDAGFISLSGPPENLGLTYLLDGTTPYGGITATEDGIWFFNAHLYIQFGPPTGLTAWNVRVIATGSPEGSILAPWIDTGGRVAPRITTSTILHVKSGDTIQPGYRLEGSGTDVFTVGCTCDITRLG